MRNILAILSGIVGLFLTALIVAFVLINFSVEPFHKFALGNFDKFQFFELSQKIIILYISIIFPIISFVPGLIAALVAKSKEYLIGLICIVPLLIIFFDYSLIYFSISLSTSISVSMGVKVAKKIKS